VVAVALVLRPPIASVGPVLSEVRADVGLSAGAVSLLTALPVLCFGAGAFAGPWAARRLGVDGALGAVLALLAVGALVRVTAGPTLLFAGTVVAGAAIAVANVLLPAVVKADFPRRVGLMTGAYTATLSGAAALSALVAVPVADVHDVGWRGALGLWGVVAVVSLLVWLPQVLRRGPAAGAVLEAPHPARRLLTNRRALAVTAYMGVQSLGFYVVLTWLPSLLRDHGYPAATAGALLSLATVLGIPVGLVLPALAARRPDQRLVVIALTAVTAAGFAGLLLAPDTLTVLWVALLGVGLGASFPLALLLVVLRSSGPAVTGQLSAMAQGFGYLVAAAGPFVVGALREATGSWGPPLVLMLACTALQAVAGWSAGRAGTAA
jgi:CP family cyanate transporter-like MFS transporter